LDPDIGRGLVRQEPAIDWRPAQGFLADATPDPEVLQFAANAGRVLVSGDISTIPRHCSTFIATRSSPGAILIPSSATVGEAIEKLLIVWLSWTAEDIENQIWWLPA
jgi:predicted nuclease of predicted toxin-antitoxin system